MVSTMATSVNRVTTSDTIIVTTQYIASSEDTMTIQWRLAVLMADRGVTPGELAKIAGLARGTVSRHKNMRIMPDQLSKYALSKYCQALNCQPGELLIFVPDLSGEATK